MDERKRVGREREERTRGFEREENETALVSAPVRDQGVALRSIEGYSLCCLLRRIFEKIEREPTRATKYAIGNRIDTISLS